MLFQKNARFSLQRLVLLMGLAFLTGLWRCSSSSEKKETEETKANSPAQKAEPASSQKKTILFFGNSLTAGYGVEPTQAFAGLIGRRIDSLKLNYTVVNAGLSGETTAGGKSRITWVLRQPVDIFVLELGANDGLRGIPLKATEENLQAIIDTVRKKSPQARIVLAGMQIPPNMGPEYTSKFRQIFPELARKNDAVLIPFLLKDVGGISRLNQSDGIHPTPEGHQIVAETVWEILEPLLTTSGTT
ncbi:arylesterase [Tellurirhabdus bombi]|uniref:arylesterase n=1 Tax=Tellurirhabdus bombi TaxID=2907205 RepID=UPI001F48F5CA|nr:arylesterase [Tellurirhabdus bombi]